MTEALAPASFFVSGGTVPLEAASYVARGADRALLDALRAGRYCYVLTSRQMGKSSLCVRTMEALRAEGVRTAFVDLTRVGGRNVSAEQWYAGLLGEVGRSLGSRAAMLGHWKDNPELSPMQRFFGALCKVALDSPEPLVVFIDEIDATRSLPFSTDEFFAGIRERFNRRVAEPALGRLTFCLLGVAVPSDLIADATLTPFNVGERIVLTDFSLEEALPLAAGLGENGKALVERAVHWTGGHPFLTQNLCRRAAEGGARTPADVDRLVTEELLEARARETNINLADVGNRVLNSYDDPDAVAKYRSDILSLYERVLKGRPVADDESNRLVAVLKLAGLLKTVGGKLRVRNRIYGRVFGPAWVKENMPMQEQRRQRRAFRRGALRTALVAAAVLGVVSAFAVKAAISERKAHRAELQARRAEAEATRQRNEAVAQRTKAEGLRQVAQGQQTEAERQRDLARKAGDRATRSADGLRRSLIAQADLAQRAAAAARAEGAQRRIAQIQTRNALGQKTFALGQRDLARRNAGEAGRQRALAMRGQASLRGELYENAVEAASLQWERNDLAEAATALASVADRKDRGWEWGYWRRLSKAAYVLDANVWTFAPSEGADVIAYNAFSARRIDPETGRTIRELWRIPAPKNPTNGAVFAPMAFRSPSFSRNGRWAIHNDAKGDLVMQDLAGGASRPVGLPKDVRWRLTISDDGLRVFGSPIQNSASAPRQSLVWDSRTWESIPMRPPLSPLLVAGRAMAPDGRALRTTYRDPEKGRIGIAYYDYETGETRQIYALPVSGVPQGGVLPFVTSAVARDGSVVVACGSRIGVFDPNRPEPRLVFDCRTERPSLSISQDGRYLLTNGLQTFGSNVRSEPGRLWDLDGGALVARPPYYGVLVGGNRILLANWGQGFAGIDWRAAMPYREAQIFRPPPPSPLPSPGAGVAPAQISESGSTLPSGTTVLTRYQLFRRSDVRLSSRTLSYSFLDVEGRLRGRYPATGDLPESAAVTTGNDWLVHWTEKDGFQFRRLPDLRLVRTVIDPSGAWPDVSRSGRRAASIDDKGILRTWTDGPRPVATLQTDLRSSNRNGTPYSVDFTLSPDGTRILGSDGTHGYRIWDFRTLRLLVSSKEVDTQYGKWSPSGKWILLDRPDNGVDRIDPLSGRRTQILPGTGSSRNYAVSPDDRLVAVNLEGEVEIRSTRTGRRLFSFATRREGEIGGNNAVSSVTFSADGRSLFVSYYDGVLRTYEGGF